MALEWIYKHWVSVFTDKGLSEEVALEEYQTWCEGLGGELDNEFQQTEFSVMMAALEAVSELLEYN